MTEFDSQQGMCFYLHHCVRADCGTCPVSCQIRGRGRLQWPEPESDDPRDLKLRVRGVLPPFTIVLMSWWLTTRTILSSALCQIGRGHAVLFLAPSVKLRFKHTYDCCDSCDLPMDHAHSTTAGVTFILKQRIRKPVDRDFNCSGTSEFGR